MKNIIPWIGSQTFFLTCTLTLSTCALAHAPLTQSKLAHLNKNIASIKTELKQAVIQKSALQNTLKTIETSENHLNQQINKTRVHLSQQQLQLHTLKLQTIPLLNAKDESRQLLKQQLRAAYMLHQEPYVKLLLAPNDVSEAQRLFMYFHYITTVQIETMQHLQASLAESQRSQHAIQTQVSQIMTLKQTQLKTQKVLQKTQVERQQLIHTIDQHIQTKQQKLAILLRDKLALKHTLAILSEQAAQNEKAVEIHFHGNLNKPFAQLRGKLSWPTPGHILHAFGSSVYQSELTWDGTLIAATEGQPVHAVAAGRVIFAKWMAGYGLLLIINHGNGYMSLYGRNQSLTKKVGDWIRTNEVIAMVGKSGGFAHDGLYFSIRHNAKAMDPAVWCS